MLNVLSHYTIDPMGQSIIDKYGLRVSNISIDYSKIAKINYADNVTFTGKLHLGSLHSVSNWCIKWSSGQVTLIKPSPVPHISSFFNVLNSECIQYNVHDQTWIGLVKPQPYVNLSRLISEMIKKQYFDDIYQKLKNNHILRAAPEEHWWISTPSSLRMPLDFIPRRYNSKPFSKMSPAERRKWHIKTALNNIPIYNPEIFTLHKMHDDPK